MVEVALVAKRLVMDAFVVVAFVRIASTNVEDAMYALVVVALVKTDEVAVRLLMVTDPVKEARSSKSW